MAAAKTSEKKITVVVGYKYEHIVEAFPTASFVYNEQYDQTNTSKSLLRALKASSNGGVLWMNGDVVFDPEALVRASELVARDQSFVSVNTSKVSDEEVKYTTDAEGFIKDLSKTVKGGLGEAVGINYVASADKAALIEHLQRCTDQDFFERGMESAIMEGRLRVQALDISDCFVVEVDFADDLESTGRGRREDVHQRAHQRTARDESRALQERDAALHDVRLRRVLPRSAP